jgi:quercetin dioxygenase-like cupin family protein
MAIHHAGAGEPINVQALGERLPDEKTVALFKSQDLELIRLVLRAGKSFATHQVPGEVTLQCIEGVLDVVIDGASQEIRAGQLVLLAANVPHSVTALEDASALVTIVVRK